MSFKQEFELIKQKLNDARLKVEESLDQLLNSNYNRVFTISLSEESLEDIKNGETITHCFVIGPTNIEVEVNIDLMESFKKDE